MRQLDIDQLLFSDQEWFRFLRRAEESALAYCLHGDESYKRSALGLYKEHTKLRNKIDNISLHLYHKIWCVASTFCKEEVKERRNKEIQHEIDKLEARKKDLIEGEQNNITSYNIGNLNYQIEQWKKKIEKYND